MSLKARFEQSHPLVKSIQWILCMLLFMVGVMGALPFLEQPFSTTALKWVQFLQTTAVFLLPPLCMAYLWSPQPLQWLNLQSSGTSSMTKSMAIGLMIVALPAINMLGYWNQHMTLPSCLEPLEQWMKTQEETAQAFTEQFMNVTTFGALIINILLMAVLPALAEELTFRGLLQRLLTTDTFKPRIPHVAIWCSAIIFSAIHLQFYGFVPRMLMGALFGYALVWTGSLWIPILMHFTNNAIAVILYFIAYNKGWDMQQIDAIGTSDTLWMGIVSLVLTIGGIYAFRRSTTMSSASSRISNGN